MSGTAPSQAQLDWVGHSYCHAAPGMDVSDRSSGTLTNFSAPTTIGHHEQPELQPHMAAERSISIVN